MAFRPLSTLTSSRLLFDHNDRDEKHAALSAALILRGSVCSEHLEGRVVLHNCYSRRATVRLLSDYQGCNLSTVWRRHGDKMCLDVVVKLFQ